MVSLHKQALEDCFQLQTCSRRLNLRGPVGCDFKLFFYLHNSRLNIEDDLGTTVFQPKTFFAINYLAFFPPSLQRLGGLGWIFFPSLSLSSFYTGESVPASASHMLEASQGLLVSLGQLRFAVFAFIKAVCTIYFLNWKSHNAPYLPSITSRCRMVRSFPFKLT